VFIADKSTGSFLTVSFNSAFNVIESAGAANSVIFLVNSANVFVTDSVNASVLLLSSEISAFKDSTSF